ncbi:MAG: hypothetical protein Q9191_002572 [Dirinaria sp. TL-2023a]
MPSPTSPTAGNRSACPWTAKDDAELRQARQKGLNWTHIAETYFPGKSANACRKRHERLVDKQRSTEDWDQAKIEDLAHLYVELREQMWRIIASRMNEKWEIVESKVSYRIHPGHPPPSSNASECMEKGVKVLKTTSRSSARRDRSSRFEDSGLGNSALLPDVAPQHDPYSASHSSRRSTGGSTSSFAPNTLPTTPMIPFTPSPQAQNPPYPLQPHGSLASGPYQPPSQILQQQQQQRQQEQQQHHHRQNLPSISHIIATAAPPGRGTAVTTH